MAKNNKTKNTRRAFVKTAATGAAGFMIVPRAVLGGNGYTAPSDKLNLAAIGSGGKGWSDIRNAFNKGKENVVALCDIDKSRAKNATQKWPKAKLYSDFREMLEKSKDIDAVTISTPDHTHAVAAMAAMQLGKHVYVQKPLTHNIYEARMLTKTARAQKVVTQMGNQGASNPGQQQMITWMKAGKIGKVKEVYVWTNRPVWPQGKPAPNEFPDRPSHISKEEWELFIGPAEYKEYHPLFHPFKWRGWWNFGTGALGDMGCHIIDPAFRVLELGYPSEVECSVGQVFEKDWVPEVNPGSCPPSSYVQLKFSDCPYSDGSIKMTWTDGGIRPPHPDLIPADEPLSPTGSDNGVIIMGENGIMTCGVYGAKPMIYMNDGEVIKMPEDYATDNPFEKLPEYGHQVSWTNAIKAGFDSKEHKALTSSFDYAGPLTETVLMGNLAIRSYMLVTGKNKRDRPQFEGRKKLLWDGENMKITNFEQANQFVFRDYRKGWSLGA